MQAKGFLFRSAIAGVIAIAASASMSSTAKAQDLIDFLWGGGEEWGGGRQVVTFDSQYRAGQIIVSFGDRRLYLIQKPGTALSYPIAAPREQSRWQGKLSVTMKKVNPSWTPTPEMFRENPKLPSWVPGGHPMNPLGVRALYLGQSTYRIHGTDAPWTIGQAVSKGCIRMYNEDVLDLYPRVPVGTVVTVTWERFKTSPTGTEVSRLNDEKPVKEEKSSKHGAEPVAVSDKNAEVTEIAPEQKPEAKPEAKKEAGKKPVPGDDVDRDEGYAVDATSGTPRVTKIGRKPLVTRASATAEAE